MSILRPIPRFLIVLCALCTLSSCSGPSILNALIPYQGYWLRPNIAYDTGPRQQLDIYLPTRSQKPAPVLVFFYGGSWQKGSKEEYRFIGQAFASRGFVTVIADYRLYPEVYFPSFMDDAARALRWTRNHIADYGGDTDNIFVAGHSAGAYIAVMLTVHPDYLRKVGGTSDWIRGTIGIAGPYDFLPFTDPNIQAIFSKKPARLTQPVHFVRRKLPPLLLLTGDSDQDVLPRNSFQLEQRWKRYHNPVKVIIYPDLAHIGIILATAHGFEGKAPVLRDMERFMHQHLQTSTDADDRK